MPTQVILDITAREDKLNELKNYLREILPETRQYPGYIALDVLTNIENPNNLVVYETWESPEAYQTYVNWRAENGVFDKLGEMVAEAPKVRLLAHTGI